MGIPSKIISVLLILVAGFMIGYHQAATSGANAPVVTVKIVNDSGKSIRMVHLTHNEGSVDVNEMADKASHVARFYAPGESSYRIEVTFDDGQFLEAGPRHVEAGMQAVETIKESSVEPDFKGGVVIK